MLRICGQLQEQKELAIQALIWIVHAKRALTTSELQHALSVQAGELEFYEDNMPDLEDTISACCGLVTVDEGRGIVRLIHYTAQEFFEGQGASYLPNAHVEIANTCVTYLSFGEFNSGPCQQERDFDQRLAQFSLFEYSSHYWGHHLNGLEQSELVQEFLDRPNQVQGSSQALLVDKWRWKYLEKAPSQVTGLHLAAYFGISVSMVKKILTKSHIDAQDSHRRTPLLYASERGHEAIVDLLLENNAQVDTKDTQYGRTPLSWAAKNGHEAIVHLLLEKNAQVDTKDAEYGRTPLSWAARNGYKAIVRLLLKKNAQVDVNDIEYDRTPLLWAAKNGHEGVVRLLLEKNAQVDAEDTEYGQTSLSWAAKNGYEAIVRLLLQKMAQVDAQDTGYGRMPVSWAAENGHEGIVRLLLENNAQVDTQDTQHGRTPVSWAAENGHEAVVRLLLEKNVQVNTPDKNGWTPLLWATEKGHEAIVRLLLERNIQIDTPAENGWTPLLWATKKGHEGIVRVLLENNVQVDTPDKKGRTPLLWAAQKGYEGIVHLLLERNAQVDAKDTKHGRTSLSWAAGNGHEAVVRALLKYGAHAQSSDRRHCTVLFYAILAGKSQIVSILTDLVADIDVKDYYGSSLVSVAARLGHAAIVQQLVRVPSIDAVSADQFGRAPIWWANNQGHKSIVRDLAGFCGASDLKLLLNTPDVCHPFNFTLKGRSCDVCLAATGEKYHHCESCLGGDFDICDRCYNLGAHCLDRSHILV